MTGIVLLAFGLILAMYGVKLAKLMASLAFGLAMGYLLYAHSSPGLRSALGQPALFVVGFVLGALIGFSVFKLAISLLAGFFVAYAFLSLGIVVSTGEALALLSLVFAAIAYYVAEKLLALVFAVVGAGLVFLGLLSLGLGAWISALGSLVVFVVSLVKGR